jgi:hypothetical protein
VAGLVLDQQDAERLGGHGPLTRASRNETSFVLKRDAGVPAVPVARGSVTLIKSTPFYSFRSTAETKSRVARPLQ